MPDAERMVVELAVYVDVPADITEEQMDAQAASIRGAVADTLDYRVAVSRPASLVPRPFVQQAIAEDVAFDRTEDARDRYQDTEVDA